MVRRIRRWCMRWFADSSLSCWPVHDRARRCDMVQSTMILQDARSLVAASHPCRHPISDRSRCTWSSHRVRCTPLHLMPNWESSWWDISPASSRSNTPPKMIRRKRRSNTPRAFASSARMIQDSCGLEVFWISAVGEAHSKHHSPAQCVSGFRCWCHCPK